MRAASFVVVFVVALAIYSSSGGVTLAFSIEHMNFVIHPVTSGYLFRSGAIVKSYEGFYHELKYKDLVDALTSAATLQGNITLPNEFYIVDINLLNPNNSDDRKYIKAETKYFSENPIEGKIIQYPILGEKVDPTTVSNQTQLIELASTFNKWSVDRLPAFVENIWDLVTADATPTVVALIHCMCGCDRTGQVTGSFYMQYMNMSFHDAYALDKKIAGRDINNNNKHAMLWHCLYLKYGQNRNISCDE